MLYEQKVGSITITIKGNSEDVIKVLKYMSEEDDTKKIASKVADLVEKKLGKLFAETYKELNK